MVLRKIFCVLAVALSGVGVLRSETSAYPVPAVSDSSVCERARRAEVGDATSAETYLKLLLARERDPLARSEILYRLGDGYFLEGSCAKALRYFDPVEDASPFRPEAAFKMGLCNFELGRYVAAVRDFDEVISGFPGSGFLNPALFWRAESHYRLGEYEESLADYSLLLGQELSTRTRALAELGAAWSLTSLGRRSEAVEHFISASKGSLSRDWKASCRVAAAENAFLAGDAGRAGRVLTELLQEPGRAAAGAGRRALFLLAQISFDNGDYEKATELFERVASESGDPRETEWSAYAGALGEYFVSDFKASRRLFTEFVEKFPLSVRAASVLHWLALSELKLERYDDALRHVERCLDLEPSGEIRLDALYTKAYALVMQERYREALDTVESLLEESLPDSLRTDAELLKGESAYFLGDFATASKVFESQWAREADPEILFKYALSELYRGRSAAAERALRRLAFLFPKWRGNGEALFWLAEAQYRRGEFQQARRVLRRLIDRELAPERMDQIYYSLGWCYYETGDYAKALDVFGVFKDRFPGSSYIADGTYRYANCLYNLGRIEDALSAYRRVAETYPGSPVAPEAMFQAGWCLYRLERFKEAADAFADLLRSKELRPPVVFRAVLWRAYSLFRAGSYAGARQTLGKLEAYPGVSDSLRAEADLVVADSYFNENRTEEAIRGYREIVALSAPVSVVERAYQRLWWSLYRLERFAEAEQAARELIQRFPRSEAALAAGWQLGEESLRKGRARKAAEWFGRFAEMSSSRDSVCLAFLRVGKELLDQGELDEAFSNLGKAVPCTGSVGDEARYLLGACLFRKGQYAGAIARWKDAISKAGVGGWRLRSAFGIAEAHEALGETIEALDAYRIVIEASPGDSLLSARAHLASALLLPDGETDAKLRYLEAAASMGDRETRSRAHLNIGYLFRARSRWQDSIKEFSAAASEGSPGVRAQALYGKAEAFEKMDRWDRALETYREIAAIPDPKWSEDAKTRIEWISDNRWLLEGETGAGGDSARIGGTE